jgi:two-component system response regulator FixJ
VPLAIEAMRAGVKDFIEKPFDDEALLASIRSALAEGAEALEQEGQGAELRARLDSLSPRERQVLDGLVAGQANKVIAYDLELSPRTVEVYRANVMTKMQARSLSELVRMSMVAQRG